MAIPKSLSNLTQNYFVEYEYLTNINIPLNETRVIYGNKIYNNNECFDQSILLPTSIQIINGMKVEPFTSFVVPSFVTSLEEHCFFRCRKLEELVIPETVKEVTRNVIQHLYLTSLTIPSWMKVYGNKIMNDKKDFKEVMVFDRNTMKQINGKEIEDLTKLELPSDVTSFSFNFEYDCGTLKEIIIPESFKDIPKDMFKKYCHRITQLSIPLNETRVIYGNKLMNNLPCFGISIQLPSSVQMINGMEVEKLTSFTVPSFVTSFEESNISNEES